MSEREASLLTSKRKQVNVPTNDANNYNGDDNDRDGDRTIIKNN